MKFVMPNQEEFIYQAIMDGMDMVIVAARDKKREYAFDLYLPSPQTTGTYTQRSTYARLAAQKMNDSVKQSLRRLIMEDAPTQNVTIHQTKGI